MLLSIYTIYDYLLKNKISAEAYIVDGFAGISSFCMDGCTGSTIDRLVIKQPSPNVFSLVHNMDYIMVKECNLSDIVNVLSNTFSYFNNWSYHLLTALAEDCSLQDLIDIAHDVFQRPMFIKGDSSWVYAITSGYDPAIHPDWSKLEKSLNSREADFDSVKKVSLDPEFQAVFQQKIPTIQKSPFYKSSVLRTNIWIDERRACEIVILEHKKTFTQSDVHLLYTFAEIVKKHIIRNKATFFSFSGLSAFFISMLEEKECSATNMKTAKQMAKWEDNDDLAVVIIQAKFQNEAPLTGVLRESLINALRCSPVFPFENRTVCIINITKNSGYKSIVELLAKTIPDYAFIWSMSYEFNHIAQVPRYYKQALVVLNQVVKSDVVHLSMRDIAYNYIVNKINEAVDVQEIFHPDLLKLKDADLKNDSEYLETLLVFLLCGGNYTDAAGKLSLHRNSLIYRISRIKEIINSDLDRYEDKKLLLFSLLLMENRS